MIQKTEWGHINWIHTNSEDANQSFSVGITCLLPGKHLTNHIHYGIEQFIYILDGEGIYYINGEKKIIAKGMYFYFEPNIEHETINTGDVALKELLISSTVNYNSSYKLDSIFSENSEDPIINYNNNIYVAVEAIRSQLIGKSISLPFTIYDDMWSIVLQNNNFSNYCNLKCKPTANNDKCNCMLQRNFNDLNIVEGSKFKCEYGLTVFHYPIIYKGIYLGAIRGGHILISDSSINSNEELYDFPISSIIGIKSLLKQIVKSIYNYCEFNSSRQLIEGKNKAIKDEINRNEILKNNLYVINDKVTNLKINHHFLFNTLNSLASMSLSGNRYDLYNSIIDLSKMFRYTMTVDLKFVSLKSEIEYLETYLNLQKLRYGNDLEVKYFINSEIENIKVPFNFLQPIVENAFTHGFLNSDNKKLIKINIEKLNNKAIISVINNGILFSEVTLNRVVKSIINNSGHGLSLVYEKLKSAFDTEFSIDLKSNENYETCVIVEIPIIYKEEAL
ncbi:MAG: histidine kinase [Sedimentibacter sp.]